MILRHILFRQPEYPRDLVKSRFIFRLREDSLGIPPLPQRPKAFRDPAGPYLLQKIGSALRGQGYEVGEPVDGYGTIDSILNVVKAGSEFGIAIGLWREEGFLNTILNVGPRPVLWYRKRPAANVPALTGTCDDLAAVLEQLLGRDSFTRYTPDEDTRRRRRRLALVE